MAGSPFIHPRLQGVLITGTGLIGFVVVMVLMPRLKKEKGLSIPLAPGHHPQASGV